MEKCYVLHSTMCDVTGIISADEKPVEAEILFKLYLRYYRDDSVDYSVLDDFAAEYGITVLCDETDDIRYHNGKVYEPILDDDGEISAWNEVSVIGSYVGRF